VPSDHEIRLLTPADVPRAAAAVARAFHDDPLQVWALPDAATREPVLTQIFAVVFEHVDVPLGMSYTDATCSTAAIWLPPERHPVSTAGIAALRALDAQLATIGAGARFHAAQVAMDAVRPPQRHYYLQGLGTDPPCQGRGLASAALAPMLERCDAERVPAYLESTKEANIVFYERHGFRVMGTIDVPPDGPRLWTMWRDPG